MHGTVITHASLPMGRRGQASHILWSATESTRELSPKLARKCSDASVPIVIKRNPSRSLPPCSRSITRKLRTCLSNSLRDLKKGSKFARALASVSTWKVRKRWPFPVLPKLKDTWISLTKIELWLPPWWTRLAPEPTLWSPSSSSRWLTSTGRSQRSHLSSIWSIWQAQRSQARPEPQE